MDKELLEDYPLFKKVILELPTNVHKLKKVSINMYCARCNSTQTFLMKNEYNELNRLSDIPCAGENVRLFYVCQGCGNYRRQFNIHIEDDGKTVYKFGQQPAWEIKMDRELKKILGEHSSLYQKGLICESQGYGIGAFSYYRRIVENIIDQLLELVADLVEGNQKEKYLAALDQVKNTRVTQDKIALVKDLLPPILIPNGNNPLGILHSELSSGLHGESDDLCLEKAGHIKSILIFLINQIIKSKESAKAFTDGMRSLLDKKSQKGAV